eukprot:gene1817-959_t
MSEREQKRAEKQQAKKEKLTTERKQAQEKKDKATKKGTGHIKNIKAKVQKALKEEKNTNKAAKKVWHNVVFRRPRTQRLPKAPKYPRRGVQKRNKMDKFAVLKYPLQSENVMRLIEEQNTLVFIVNKNSGKKDIKSAFKQMYEAKVGKVRTSIRPTGEKKAFIKLAEKEGAPKAIDVASKIGLV